MRERDATEERRLAYVGFTRAEQTLILTGHWWGPTQVKRRGPSDYLTSARDFCSSGGGQIWHWEPEPSDDASNPALAASSPVTWPVGLEPSAGSARQAGAGLVLAAIGRLEHPEPGAVVVPAVDERVSGWDADLSVLLAEVRELHAPEREVRLPAQLSASSLVRLAQDPAGLAQDLARPMPRRPAPAARRGTRFHAWVESLFGQAALIDLDELDEAGSDDEASDLAVLQQAFLAGPFADRAPFAVEAPFQLVLGGHAISGRIDAVYRLEDDPDDPWAPAYQLVDWKTGAAAADPLQLAIYRLAWAELHNLPVQRVATAFYYVSRGVVDVPKELPDRDTLTSLLTSGAVASSGAYSA